MAPRDASIQIWSERALLCARAMPGAVQTQSPTTYGVLVSLHALHPCPSLRPLSGLGFAHAGLSGLCGSALGWAGCPASTQGSLWCSCLPSPGAGTQLCEFCSVHHETCSKEPRFWIRVDA